MSKNRKATIEIEFTIDGQIPNNDALLDAVSKMVRDASYIGSEEVDGTDKWGLDIVKSAFSISDE